MRFPKAGFQQPRINRTAIFCVVALLSGCVSPMSIDRQQKVDGLIVYGLVNASPSADLTTARHASAQAKQSCLLYPETWCQEPEAFRFVSLLLMNSYSGGLRSVGVFAPTTAMVSKGDIVVARLRKAGTGEFIRVASKGESDDCRWVGGGPTRALTSAGVVCEKYDWRSYSALFYD
jgi:hypothetical protein